MSFIKKNWFILLLLVIFLWVFTLAYSTARTALLWAAGVAAAVHTLLNPTTLSVTILAYIWAGLLGFLTGAWYSVFGSPPPSATGNDLNSGNFSIPSTNSGGQG